MYCVCKVIKHPKTVPKAFLFIGEPQNLTQLGYHSTFGLKDLIYVKITAHRALARLSPALARSKSQIAEPGMGTALERPWVALERPSLVSAPSLFLCWFLLFQVILLSFNQL